MPTSFGEFHGVVTDASGNVVEDFVDPPAAKGQSGSHARATTTSCTFTIDASIVDPDLGPVTITGEGSLDGFVTPVR